MIKRRYYLFISVSVLLIAVVLVSLGLLGIFSPQKVSITKINQINTGGRAQALQVIQNYAYVLDLSDLSPQGLVIVNVSDPYHPTRLSNLYPGGEPNELAISGNYVYLANMISGLQIVNITDPLHPSQIAYSSPYSQVSDVFVKDDVLFLSAWNDGLIVMNISTPWSPQILSVYTNFNGVPAKFALDENRLYVIDHLSAYSGLIVLDISNLGSLTPLGNFYNTEIDLWIPIIRDGFLYAADHGGSGDLIILNLNNPSEITQIASFDTGGSLDRAIFINNTTLCLADYTKGILFLDIIDRTTPRKIGSFYDGGHSRACAYKNGILFVADEEDSLEILQISFN